MYLCGLMLDGERKSIQPMAERLPGGNEQAMQQFVNQSPWDYTLIQTKLVKFLCQELSPKKGVLILGVASENGKNRTLRKDTWPKETKAL